MVKKIKDIYSKNPTTPPKHFWSSKPKPKKSTFILFIIGLFLLVNFTAIYFEGRQFITNFRSSTQQGITSFMQAKDNIKLANFNDAKNSFASAEKIFTNLNQDSWFLSNSIANPNLLIDSAQILADVGQELSSIALQLKDLPETFLQENSKYLNQPELKPTNLTKPIESILPSIDQINQDINQVQTNLSQINASILPNQIRQQFTLLKSEINSLQEIILQFQNYLQIVLDLLGAQLPHTYLILLQNNFETRPTGGFLGSMIFSEVNKGILTEFTFKDVYDFDGILIDNPTYLPPEYQGFNELLWIRDSNYTPDFAISASRIETLLQRAKAPSFDTIISIDQSFIEAILDLTGPIKLPSYNASITADNYFTVLTYLIEANKDSNEADKQVLSEFINSFKQGIFNIIDFQSLAKIFSSNLEGKHIQLFSKKKTIQTQLDNFKFSNKFTGNQTPKNENYLLITNSSIGGNKTDKYLHQRYILNTHFNTNHTITNTLTIRKHHSFSDREELRWQSQLRPFGIENPFGIEKATDFTRYILGRGDNISMVKVYVPNNTKLLSTTGIPKSTPLKTYMDPDLKTNYFLFPMSVSPGKTHQVTLTYTPPIKLKPSPTYTYTLNLQSQAGTANTTFDKTYSFQNPLQQRVFSHNPQITSFDPAGNPQVSFPLTKDLQLQALYSITN